MNEGRHPNEVWLAPLSESDIERVDRLLDRLRSYSLAVDGVAKVPDGARHLLAAAPPGHDDASKAVFEVKNGGEPVGLVDLVDDYPQPGTTFVGLLAIAEDRHGKGLGRAAYQAVEAHVLRRFRTRTLRLAFVSTNPVEGFWKKMGFSRTGEVRPHSGKACEGVAILMEKKLERHDDWSS